MMVSQAYMEHASKLIRCAEIYGDRATENDAAVKAWRREFPETQTALRKAAERRKAAEADLLSAARKYATLTRKQRKLSP